MSSYCGRMISLLISEYFGPVVGKIAKCLHDTSSVPLLFIKRNTNLPLSKVKEGLCILIKYQLVSFTPNRNSNIANYSLRLDRVLLILRYPKYIALIKSKFSGGCEMIIEDLLLQGYGTASNLILTIVNNLKKNNKIVSVHQIKDNFISLLTARYIVRFPVSEDERPVPLQTFLLDAEAFKPPPLDVKELINVIQGKSDKGKQHTFKDSNIYWTINFDRFHQDIRDSVIVTNFRRKFGTDVAEFVKILLQQMYIRSTPWAEVSNPISIVDLKNVMMKLAQSKHLLMHFDQLIKILEEDTNNLIRRSGDAGGGSLEIHIKKLIELFTWETIEQIVLEKFDTKAARIFRLVRLKQMIDLDQIQKLAMIPAKDAKRLVYGMLQNGFLLLQEARKNGPGGPSKCPTLFHINLLRIVHSTLELCFKTISNAMLRNSHEKYVNKRIIDKKQRVDTILLSMKAQNVAVDQLQDIEDMITPPEKELLNGVDVKLKKLNSVDLAVDETIFLLQTYLIYR